MSVFEGSHRILRTYSRTGKRLRDDAEAFDTNKRRRLGELPDTPKLKAFPTIAAWLKSAASTSTRHVEIILRDSSGSSSNEQRQDSTPPSSPPPATHEILDARIQPARSTKDNLTSEMTQMQINVGSRLQTTCKTCGMTFVKASQEDRAMHDKFHSKTLNGIELGKPFAKLIELRTVYRRRNEAAIVVIDAACGLFAQRKVREVLDVVQAELGAVDIADETLWASLEPQDTFPCQARPQTNEAKDEIVRPQYRAYLYMVKTRCVGLCLAKRISAGRTVVSEQENPDGIELAQVIVPATIGISRIWASKQHRKVGVATSLLDAVAHNFGTDNNPTPKHMVAFSQPTTSGTALARRWFGKRDGWLVYID